MSKKGRRYTPEQIITLLREAEVLQNQGMSIEEAARKLDIASQTYDRWRKKYGDMNTTRARKLKELEKENLRLKKLVADLSLDNAILKEVLSKKVVSPDRRREAVKQVMEALQVSERRACRVIGQPRATQRYPKRMAEDEEVLRE